jgi:hypothetical protein
MSQCFGAVRACGVHISRAREEAHGKLSPKCVVVDCDRCTFMQM